MNLVHLRVMGTTENLCEAEDGWWTYVVNTASCPKCLQMGRQDA